MGHSVEQTVLGHKLGFNKFQRTEISVYSNHNAIKLEINTKI